MNGVIIELRGKREGDVRKLPIPVRDSDLTAKVEKIPALATKLQAITEDAEVVRLRTAMFERIEAARKEAIAAGASEEDLPKDDVHKQDIWMNTLYNVIIQGVAEFIRKGDITIEDALCEAATIDLYMDMLKKSEDVAMEIIQYHKECGAEEDDGNNESEDGNERRVKHGVIIIGGMSGMSDEHSGGIEELLGRLMGL